MLISFSIRDFLHKFSFFLLILLCMKFHVYAQQTEIKRPLIVKYGIFVKKLSVDYKNATFHSEFFWWAIFDNDSSKTGILNDDILNFEYVNGVNVETGSVKNEIQYVRKEGNNYWVSGFHQGDFYFNPDFSMYPFDNQHLEIKIENTFHNSSELVFVSDVDSYVKARQSNVLYGISRDLIKNNSKSSTILSKTNITVENGIYNTDFGDIHAPSNSNYSRINISMTISRSFLPYISKLIIPLMIILILVYFVFYLPAEKLDIAAGLTVTSLLSAIAFQTAISTDIPEIGYLIYIDKIFYTCYFLIALAMAQSLITYYLDFSENDHNKKLAVKLDIWFRYIFPLFFLSAVVLFAI